MEVALTIAKASTHPKQQGGCIIINGREIIGDGRSLLTASGVEIDCLSFAIGTAAKRGTPLVGSVVYTTRYPFSHSIFQAYLMGIKKIVVLAHEWEPYLKDEFRRSARLARELGIAIEPIYPKADPRLDNRELVLPDGELLDSKLLVRDEFYLPDEYDPQDKTEIHDD